MLTQAEEPFSYSRARSRRLEKKGPNRHNKNSVKVKNAKLFENPCHSEVRRSRTVSLIYPFALIICSACFREVSVSFAPLSMRATSSVRSSPTTRRMPVRVRPPDSFFSIT